MSSSIWTRCGAKANLRRLGGRAFRVVEGQHVLSTRKLVDSAAEHDLLEALIDRSKPPYPENDELAGLHYLLATPFRYPPLPHGSRFASRAERSLWYGSNRPLTAFAETAYYRLYFLEGSAAHLGPLTGDLTLFHVPIRTARGVDLSREPFDRLREAIASPLHYAPTQQLGREMRADGVQAFRYPSARDVSGGVNVALFTPRAFAARVPATPETWHCVATRSFAEFVKRDFFGRQVRTFPRSDFEVDGRLPNPAP